MRLHHATLFIRDAHRSLHFYRDALGLVVLLDREFDDDWPELFGVASRTLRAIILGDPDKPNAGQVELVTFREPVSDGAQWSAPATASVMLSFHVDHAAVLPLLGESGGTDLRRITLANGYAVASVRDPDGILVQLIDTTPPAGPS